MTKAAANIRVLIGCETSGQMRRAFLARGFDAWSCDLLPADDATNRLTPPNKGSDAHQRWSAVHRASPGRNRWKLRSATFPGIAAAAAQQWGDHAMQVAT